MNRRSSVKAWPLPLIGRFPQRGFPIGRQRRHVMYGRAGLLIRRGVKGGGFFVTVGGCLAGLALTSWLELAFWFGKRDTSGTGWGARHSASLLASAHNSSRSISSQSSRSRRACGNLDIWSHHCPPRSTHCHHCPTFLAAVFFTLSVLLSMSSFWTRRLARPR